MATPAGLPSLAGLRANAPKSTEVQPEDALQLWNSRPGTNPPLPPDLASQRFAERQLTNVVENREAPYVNVKFQCVVQGHFSPDYYQENTRQLYKWYETAYGMAELGGVKNPQRGLLGQIMDVPITRFDDRIETIADHCLRLRKKIHLIDGANVFKTHNVRDVVRARYPIRREYEGLGDHAVKQCDLEDQGNNRVSGRALPIIVMRDTEFKIAFGHGYRALPGTHAEAGGAYRVLQDLLEGDVADRPAGDDSGRVYKSDTPIVCVAVHFSPPVQAPLEVEPGVFVRGHETEEDFITRGGERKCGLVPRDLDQARPELVRRFKEWGLKEEFFLHSNCEQDDFLISILNDQLKGYDALRETWGPSGVPEWLRALQALVPPNPLIVSNDRNVDKIAGSREIFDEGSEGRDYMENVLDTQRLMLHAEAARMDDLLFQYNMAAANIYVANKYDDQPTTDPEDALGTFDLGYGPSQPGGYGKSGRGDVDGAALPKSTRGGRGGGRGGGRRDERGRGRGRGKSLLADREREREAAEREAAEREEAERADAAMFAIQDTHEEAVKKKAEAEQAERPDSREAAGEKEAKAEASSSSSSSQSPEDDTLTPDEEESFARLLANLERVLENRKRRG